MHMRERLYVSMLSICSSVCLSVCLFVCRHITFFTPRSLHFLEICLDATAVLHSHSHSSKAFNLINWKKKKKYKSMHYKVAAVLPLSNCRLYSDIVQYLSPPKTAKTTRASSPRYRMDERKCGWRVMRVTVRGNPECVLRNIITDQNGLFRKR